MQEQGHNNSSLAEVAGVSKCVVRNILKHGNNPKAKDPDARTLRRIADALGINSLKLFRLAGYIPPAPDANTVRAEYLADVFDELPPEKQDAVMGVVEAMAEPRKIKNTLNEMRRDTRHALAGIDLNFPAMIREAANQLIAQYAITTSADIKRIEADAQIGPNKWSDLPVETRERIKALIRHKLSLDYDPTMVDPDWRK